MSADATAYVLLEDGTRFDGLACGADAPAVGEIVFTTSMAGYQEAMSDPSYAGQLITFTFPQIGNYGVSAEAMESDRVHARAAIMRAASTTSASMQARACQRACRRTGGGRPQGGWLSWLTDCGVPAITDLDTRALVRHIRDQGAMRGGVFPARLSHDEARALIAAEPSMIGRDLAREVTPSAPVILDGQGNGAARGVKIAMIDTGRQALDPAQPPGPRRHRRAASVHGERRGAAGRQPRRDLFGQRPWRSRRA